MLCFRTSCPTLVRNLKVRNVGLVHRGAQCMSVWQKKDHWSGQGKGGENYSGRLHGSVAAEGAGGPWLH